MVALRPRVWSAISEGRAGTARPEVGAASGASCGRGRCRVGFTRGDEPIERSDAHAPAGPEWLAVGGACLPELPVHVDEAAPTHFADGALDAFGRHLDRLVAHLPRLADGERP